MTLYTRTALWFIGLLLWRTYRRADDYWSRELEKKVQRKLRAYRRTKITKSNRLYRAYRKEGPNLAQRGGGLGMLRHGFCRSRAATLILGDKSKGMPRWLSSRCRTPGL